MRALIWTPPGKDERRFEYDFEDLTLGEMTAIEKVTSMTMGEAERAILDGSVIAISALFWVLRKRAEPTLGYSGVRDVKFRELDVERDGVRMRGGPVDEPKPEPDPDPPKAAAAEPGATDKSQP